MQVRLLGPVDVLVDGMSRPVPGSRRKAVLAVLAMHAGEIVSTDRLVDIVWGDTTPSTAANTLQSHVSYLRRLLGHRTAIIARPPGYLLDLGDEGTDVQVAERLIRRAERSTDHLERVGLLREALALWRGQPLMDISTLIWTDEQTRRLDQLWLRATRLLVESRLALGEHALVVPDLQRLVQEHPLDEQLHAHLMLALYHTGRQADALGVYQRLRQALDDDLGIDPGPAMRDLYSSILRQDPELHPASSARPGAARPPAQLPPAVTAFAGRDNELAHLDKLLAGTGSNERPAAVVVSAVSGTAGAGKTALAVYWAHRVADRFPDGQLYVNLRGFDPSGSVLDPADAARRFLDALGVPPERIPADPEAQIALYRGRLVGKRILVLLDNARDSAHARPLLPGTPTGLAVVTSRSQLTGLIAADGAQPVNVDVLTVGEARELLARRLGAERIAAEPEAVEHIIAYCARLPLALAILAARAATQPHLPLSNLASELRERRERLDGLLTDDPHTDVRAVFSWSYHALTPGTAWLFRLLGLHPGPDISTAAAASLAALAVSEVRSRLADLARANLVIEHAPGRFTCHDLLCAYATDLAQATDTDEQRHESSHRLLDHYLHTAYAADRLLDPTRDLITLDPPLVGVSPEHLADRAEALAWLAAEHPILLAAVDHAVATGSDLHAWRLGWTLATYLYRRGFWHQQATAGRAALAASRRLADPKAQAFAHRMLGTAYSGAGRLDEAHAELRKALELSEQIRDRVGQAHAHDGLGTVLQRQRRHSEALDQARRAFELYRASGKRAWQANALNGIGLSYVRLGDHRRALTHCRRALRLLQELGDREGEAATWISLGHAHLGLADHEQSSACYQRAIEMFREAGDRYREAFALAGLGDAQHAAGNPNAAGHAWRQALVIFDDLGHPDAEAVRAKLVRA